MLIKFLNFWQFCFFQIPVSAWTYVCPGWTNVCPGWTYVCPTWTNVCTLDIRMSVPTMLVLLFVLIFWSPCICLNIPMFIHIVDLIKIQLLGWGEQGGYLTDYFQWILTPTFWQAVTEFMIMPCWLIFHSSDQLLQQLKLTISGLAWGSQYSPFGRHWDDDNNLLTSDFPWESGDEFFRCDSISNSMGTRTVCQSVGRLYF